MIWVLKMILTKRKMKYDQKESQPNGLCRMGFVSASSVARYRYRMQQVISGNVVVK